MTGAKVLVVEDEGIIAKDIHSRLGRMGYEVLIPVSNGKAAIQTTEENHPDLILMDIMLKGDMDGIQTVTQIRKHFDIPVIYLTANSDSHTVERAKETRPHGFLLKPFKDAEAQICIEMALYKHGFERKLREKEEELATILRCVGDAVIAADEHGAVTFLNPAGEALTGWSAKDANGRQLEDVVQFVDEATGARISALALTDSAKIKVFKPALLVARDGSRFPVEHSSAPLLDEEHVQHGSVIALRNVRKRNEIEAELREHREKLRELVGKRSQEWTQTNPGLTRAINQHKRTTLALQRARKIAEKAAQNSNDFLAKMGQEIRTPLDNVMGLAEQLLSSDLPVEQRQHAEEISQTGKSLLAIIDNILEFAKIDMDKMESETIAFDLEKVVKEVVQSLRPKAEKKGLELTVEYATETPRRFVGDPGLVNKILTNILNNAVKFTEQGQVKVEVDYVSRRRDEAEIRVRVIDTGVGIEKEIVERISNMLDQADSFATRQYIGTDLGLALTQRLIKAMNGCIEVDSEVGKGTTFTLEFLLSTVPGPGQR